MRWRGTGAGVDKIRFPSDAPKLERHQIRQRVVFEVYGFTFEILRIIPARSCATGQVG